MQKVSELIHRDIVTVVLFAVFLFAVMADGVYFYVHNVMPSIQANSSSAFTCGEMRSLTSSNIPPMTPSQVKALSLKQQFARTTLENGAHFLSTPSSNGTTADCAPPGADFGPNGAVTFGDNAGVSSPAGRLNPGIN